MKITSVEVLNDGMERDHVEEMWDRVAGFAGYAFNLSHSVEYTLISYQTMFLKVYYPVEFIAAALSLMKEEKLPELLREASRIGITIDMPDVNHATDTFEILTDTRLMIPFTRVKGLSERAAKEIVEKRQAGGPFKSKADFEARCRSRMVHKGKMEALEKIGAYAAIEPTELPSDHPSRVKDQKELIPGLVSSLVLVDRPMVIDTSEKLRLNKLYNFMKEKVVADAVPVKPAIGKDPRFMVVFDCPTKQEEEKNMMMLAKESNTPFALQKVFEALGEANLSIGSAYWTALIKAPKSGKQVTPEEIKTYLPFLNKELDILKPAVIVLLGSTTVRQFIPDFKGKASDKAAEVVYDAALDANLIIGFSPGEIWHDPEKQDALNKVFQKAAELTE